MKVTDRAPTNEEIDQNKCIASDGSVFVASWYPQLGGYSSKAWVEIFDGGGCFDVHLFHDGDFPRNDEPAALTFHHCSADQFLRFGALVNRVQESVVVCANGRDVTLPDEVKP